MRLKSSFVNEHKWHRVVNAASMRMMVNFEEIVIVFKEPRQTRNF